jgi:hypothetical protein
VIRSSGGYYRPSLPIAGNSLPPRGSALRSKRYPLYTMSGTASSKPLNGRDCSRKRTVPIAVDTRFRTRSALGSYEPCGSGGGRFLRPSQKGGPKKRIIFRERVPHTINAGPIDGTPTGDHISLEMGPFFCIVTPAKIFPAVTRSNEP